LIEVLAVDVPKPLAGPRGADREGIQGVLVADEQNSAFLEDPAPNLERELVIEDEVEVGAGKAL
jgi:hypothetical protein